MCRVAQCSFKQSKRTHKYKDGLHLCLLTLTLGEDISVEIFLCI